MRWGQGCQACGSWRKVHGLQRCEVHGSAVQKVPHTPPLIDATLVESVFLAVYFSPFERDALAIGHACGRLDRVHQVVRRVGCTEHLEARRGRRA